MLYYLARSAVALWFSTALITAGIAQESTPREASATVILGQVDGTDRSWVISKDRTLPTATFTTFSPGVHQVRINAYADERFGRAESLLIEFTLHEDQGEIQISGLEVRHFPFDALHPRFSQGERHGQANLNIRSFEANAKSARISADLDATMFYHQSVNTRPISQRTQAIDLTLDLNLKRN